MPGAAKSIFSTETMIVRIIPQRLSFPEAKRRKEARNPQDHIPINHRGRNLIETGEKGSRQVLQTQESQQHDGDGQRHGTLGVHVCEPFVMGDERSVLSSQVKSTRRGVPLSGVHRPKKRPHSNGTLFGTGPPEAMGKRRRQAAISQQCVWEGAGRTPRARCDAGAVPAV